MSTQGNLSNAADAAREALKEAFLRIKGDTREERIENDTKVFINALYVSEIVLSKYRTKQQKIDELKKIIIEAKELTREA